MDEVFESVINGCEHAPVMVPEFVFDEVPPVVSDVGVVVLKGWVSCDHDEEDHAEGEHVTGWKVEGLGLVDLWRNVPNAASYRAPRRRRFGAFGEPEIAELHSVLT